MEREIKFKAWDKVNKKMFEVWEINFHRNILVDGYLERKIDHPDCKKCCEHVLDKSLDNFELRQYTGRKDKTKKEIYRGDLLLVDGHRTVEVIYLDCCAMFDTKYISQTPKSGARKDEKFKPLENSQWGERCEVIGNVFENKKLLNPTQ